MSVRRTGDGGVVVRIAAHKLVRRALGCAFAQGLEDVMTRHGVCGQGHSNNSLDEGLHFAFVLRVVLRNSKAACGVSSLTPGGRKLNEAHIYHSPLNFLRRHALLALSEGMSASDAFGS